MDPVFHVRILYVLQSLAEAEMCGKMGAGGAVRNCETLQSTNSCGVGGKMGCATW